MSDIFDDIVEQPKEKRTFQKTQFLSVIPGQNVIVRFLGKAKLVYTHYLNRNTVACLGEECPICLNNKRLIVENPSDFRNAKGWAAQQKRYLVNVFDRTPVKVCPNCQTENKRVEGKFLPTCYSCDAFLTTTPETVSNKVKAFSFGETLKDDLKSKRIHPVTGEELSINSFDFGLSATGVGKEKKTMSTPIYERNDVLDVPEDTLYDLDKVTIKVNPDEMLQVQRGVSLKDIFAARKGADGDTTEVEEQLSKDTLSEVKKAVEDFFSA